MFLQLNISISKLQSAYYLIAEIVESNKASIIVFETVDTYKKKKTFESCIVSQRDLIQGDHVKQSILNCFYYTF